MKEFHAHGLRFEYPATWSAVDESSEEKTAVTVQSNGSTFWTVAVFSDGPQPERVLESAIAAYRDDYPELDVYPSETRSEPRGTVVGRDLEFVCLELIAAARIEAFQSGDATVMVLFQGSDAELASHRPLLDAMTASVKVEGDERSTGWSALDDLLN